MRLPARDSASVAISGCLPLGSTEVRINGADVSVANCYFVHESSGFPVLLRAEMLYQKTFAGLWQMATL